MTEPRRVGSTERMLTVLARLASGPSRVWPVDLLRKGISGYDAGTTGDRNWHYDSEALRARGLIKTGITSRDTLRRTGVQYALPAKPGNLYLSKEEHAALVRVRRARGIVGMPNPVEGDTTRGGPIESLTGALRRLEELGDWTTVGDLARDMGKRSDRLLPILKAAYALDVDGRSVFDNVLLMDLYDDDDRERRAADVPICVCRRADPGRPLFDTGLALLGVGAYTLVEIDERLTLIDKELAGSELPSDAPALRSARSKLQRWQQILRRTARS
jgi:hypothetical protein